MINPNVEQINGGTWIVCEHCGLSVEVERASSLYCNDKCKNAFHSKKRRRIKDCALALHSLETVTRNMPKRGGSFEWDALKQMKEMIEAAMWKVEN